MYLENRNSSFYKVIKSHLLRIPSKPFVIEYGSSIGIISNTLGKKHEHVFGIDTSFSALLEAKKKSPKNCEYILSDTLQHPFGKKKFNLIIALNLFELIEPRLLLNTISSQIRNGLIFLSDPYDYDRGKNSVKHPLYEKQIRENLTQKKFLITKSTKTPSNITWTLNINKRTNLVYKVDIISARKSS
ncbi:MAG: methyltransferase domain-containing protein [Candidatus Nitrosopelagicus sp.]|nr:MAG: methyltransferase domain-containing protein [Candidatus Nitrosopelagicus sp.]